MIISYNEESWKKKKKKRSSSHEGAITWLCAVNEVAGRSVGFCWAGRERLIAVLLLK